jgi:hypothetical protein
LLVDVLFHCGTLGKVASRIRHFSAWHDSDDDFILQDVAILTRGTNWAEEIGAYTGTMPIIAAHCTINEASTMAGYPMDKAAGEMWVSNTCEGWSHSCDANTDGTSGGPIYDPNNQVFEVHPSFLYFSSAAYAFSLASASYIPSCGGCNSDESTNSENTVCKESNIETTAQAFFVIMHITAGCDTFLSSGWMICGLRFPSMNLSYTK